MASSMIHYIVSCLVAKELGVTDLNMFLLGAVLAPDTGNKEDRSYCKLHYMDIREDIAQKGFNWARFVEEHKCKMSEDYYKGYCCHLIMDALWFHDVCEKHIRHLPEYKKAEKIQTVYRDYWRLNHLLIMQYKVPDKPIRVVNIPDTRIDMESLINKAESFEQQLHAPNCNLNDLEILTWDIVTDYVNKAKELCLQEINAITKGSERLDPLDLFVPIVHQVVTK